MARTYRDKNRVKRKERWDKELADYLGGGLLQQTSLEKMKRNKHDEGRQPTPAWWINLTMTRPRRREVRLFEHNILLCIDLETCDPPANWKKPHNYYW